MAKILVTIKPGGKIQGQVQGNAGPNCAEKLNFLRATGTVNTDEMTVDALACQVEEQVEVNTGSE